MQAPFNFIQDSKLTKTARGDNKLKVLGKRNKKKDAPTLYCKNQALQLLRQFLHTKKILWQPRIGSEEESETILQEVVYVLYISIPRIWVQSYPEVAGKPSPFPDVFDSVSKHQIFPTHEHNHCSQQAPNHH